MWNNIKKNAEQIETFINDVHLTIAKLNSCSNLIQLKMHQLKPNPEISRTIEFINDAEGNLEYWRYHYLNTLETIADLNLLIQYLYPLTLLKENSQDFNKIRSNNFANQEEVFVYGKNISELYIKLDKNLEIWFNDDINKLFAYYYEKFNIISFLEKKLDNN